MSTSTSYAVISRVAAVAATLYFLLLFVVPPDGPSVETATTDQIRAYYVGNAAALHASALAAALAGPAIVVFCACLAQLVTQRVGPSVWPSLIVGGGVLACVGQWVTAAIDANTSVQGLDGTDLATVDDRVLSTWYALTNVSHLWGDLALSAVLLVLGASSGAAVRAAVLPRWLCWSGLVVAVAGALGVAGVTLGIGPLAYAWFVGLFGWTLWLPLTAVVLAVRARRQLPDAGADSPDGFVRGSWKGPTR
jgi:hypothetical protein